MEGFFLSLCKNCIKCKKHVYKKYNRKGKLIKFRYCEGNHDLIKKYGWYIQNNKPYTSNLINGGNRQISYFYARGQKEILQAIDGDFLNCALDNLEIITKGELMQKHTRGASIFPGVSIRAGYKWSSVIKRDGQHYELGFYDTELEAAHAYYSFCEENNYPIVKNKAYKIYLKEKDKIKCKDYEKRNLNHLIDAFLNRKNIKNKNTKYQYTYYINSFCKIVNLSVEDLLNLDYTILDEYFSLFLKQDMNLKINTRKKIISSVKSFVKVMK